MSKPAVSPGRLITIEGGEGAGKSTVIAALIGALEARGLVVQSAREPGGTPVGEAVRELVLSPVWHERICAESELLLMFAARAQLLRERILPALAAGEFVVSDRFTDASFAYQGGARGQPWERIRELERWAACDLQPDLTFLLDVPVAIGRARIAARGESDRMEREQDAFFERVHQAYHRRAAECPGRFRIIDASQSQAQVATDVLAELERWWQSLDAAT
ncbi:MAG: dTMP kinase [Lysobacterales bacterium]